MNMRFLFAALLLFALPGCSYIGLGAQGVKNTLPSGAQVGAFKVGKPYQIGGQWYYPQESYSYDETGIASWYGPGFHNKQTANGERYNQRELTAAHRTLQMPSFVRVTNLSNGRSVVVRVNDRGPYAKGRIIDVSEKAAELLDFKRNGVARVRVQVLPEASRQVAQAAREGRAWHGGQPQEPVMASAPTQVQPVASAPELPRPYEIDGQPVPAHQVGNAYYPDPVVTQRAVPASTQLYIQAGSFSKLENANALASQINGAFVSDKQVNGMTYHRVRVGPFSRIEDADATLARVAAQAPAARILVE
jgi:rare lipoprotein A